MPLAPRRRVRGPCGVACSQLEGLGVPRFVLLPLRNELREAQLREHAAHLRGKLRFQRRTIDSCGLVGLDPVHGTALHEQPLHAVQRSQLVMACRQCSNFGANAEQLGDEVLQMRRGCDQQIGMGPRVERSRIGPRADKRSGEVGIRRAADDRETGRPA